MLVDCSVAYGQKVFSGDFVVAGDFVVLLFNFQILIILPLHSQKVYCFSMTFHDFPWPTLQFQGSLA